MIKPKAPECRKEPIIKTVSQINANIANMNNGNGTNNGNGIGNNNNNNVHIPMMHPNQTVIAGQPNFREHIIRAPKIGSHLDMFNNSNNNNNNSTHNNNTIMTNNNSMTMNNNNNSSMINNNNSNSPSKYVIHQTNTSNKILDNQKYHKYFSKRKMMAQYENEMQSADKRNRLMSAGSCGGLGVTEDLSQKSSRRSNSPSSVSGCSDNNCSGAGSNGNGLCDVSMTGTALDLNVSQNIKVEPDIVLPNGDDDDDESNDEGALHISHNLTTNNNNNNNHNSNDCDSPRDLTASSTTAHADFYHNLADLTTKRSQHSHVVEHMAALAHIRADAESRSMSAAAAICS